MRPFSCSCSISDLTPAAEFEAVVEAFQLAFPRGDENVQLVIKTQGGAAAPVQWTRLNAMCTTPEFEIRDVRLDKEELISLIKTADAFVSLHRSEGFGFGPRQAMSLGRPVILLTIPEQRISRRNHAHVSFGTK